MCTYSHLRRYHVLKLLGKTSGVCENYFVGLSPNVDKESNPNFFTVLAASRLEKPLAMCPFFSGMIQLPNFGACCSKKLTNGQKCAFRDVPL